MPTVGRKAPNKSHTQVVVFEKSAGWTEETSRAWCKKRNYFTDGHDENERQHRWRQYDPEESRFRYRAKIIEKKNGRTSVFVILGFPKSSDASSSVKNRPNLIRVLTALYCEPWALPVEKHAALCKIAQQHLAGGESREAQRCLALKMPTDEPEHDYDMEDGCAVLHVEGVLMRKFSQVLQSSGITSTDVFSKLMRQAAEDPFASSILIVFDSPGGFAMGIPEAADSIRDAAAIKPVVAFADGLMTSGAYWLASQADLIYATKSAEIGGIGAYLAALDSSRYHEINGLKVELFRSGKFKGMGHPGTSLSEDQKKMLQDNVDVVGSKFRQDVLSRRRIEDENMQGQSFNAERALMLRMIDGIHNAETALRDAQRLGKLRAEGKV